MIFDELINLITQITFHKYSTLMFSAFLYLFSRNGELFKIELFSNELQDLDFHL